MKISKSFGLVKDLPQELSAKHDNSENGFWAFASREVIDSAGDIVRQDGLSTEDYHRPEEGIYLKILAQHIQSLPDGKAPVVGVAKDIVKTVVPYKGRMVKATAVYIEWLRNPETGELLELARHYKEMKEAGGIDQTSVGMMVTDYSQLKETGGVDIKKASLYELSLVSVPCLASANFIKQLKDKGYQVDEEALIQNKGEVDHNEGFVRHEKDGTRWVALGDHEAIVSKLVKAFEDREKDQNPNDLLRLLDGCVQSAISAAFSPVVEAQNEIKSILASALDKIDTLESALVVLSDAAKSQATHDQKVETSREIKRVKAELDRLNKFIG